MTEEEKLERAEREYDRKVREAAYERLMDVRALERARDELDEEVDRILAEEDES